MMRAVNLQDAFLNEVRKTGEQVTLFLTNGFQFKGVVKGFDNFTVILESDGKQNLVYKHAVSTVTCARTVFAFDIRDKDLSLNGN